MPAAGKARLDQDPLLTSVPEAEGYKVLGGVVLYQKLGQGGMGAVYRGRHLRLNIDVAVKVMDPPAGIQASQSGEFVRRFVREAQTAASIQHSNLIRVYDVNSESGVHFLIMDFVDGESASDRLKRKAGPGPRRGLSEAEAVEIALGAAEGLAEAHRRGIVHRDVKPDNIMIDKEGRVRVTDLGLAKAASGESDTGPSLLTQTQAAMGTPSYMPPEQFVSARDVGPRADVWSLGVTLYQLLTGDLPWSESSVFELAVKIRQEPFPDPKMRCARLSDGACAIVGKALSKDPAARYADCGEMAQALGSHLASLRTGGRTVLADPEVGRTKSALVTMTPPASRTMSIIGMSVVSAGASPRAPASGRAQAPPSGETASRGIPAWGIATAVILIVLVVAGAVVWAVLAKTNGDKDHLAGAAYEDPLEAEAQRFLGRAMGIADDGRLDEAARLLADAGGKYDATVAGPKIARLAETLAARIEAKKREDGDRKRREEEAKLAGLLADAERSEKAGDLDAAVEFLRRAQAMQDDAAVRERIARLERALAARRLLHEGIAHEGGGRLAEAAGAYEKAMPDALGADGDEAERRLAAVRKRIAVEQAVASVQGKIDARQWRAAWDAAGAAKANGVADPRIEELARRAANELAPKKALTGPLGIELVLVPGGTFRMGSDSGGDHEKPVHEVTVSSFYLGRHEVTQAQYEGVMGANPSRAKGASLPVEQVSWFDATEFCRRLSAKSGAQFRLPTEAEWEYAARGGQGRTYPWGEDPPGPRRANLKGRADGHEGAAPVGSFPDGATPEGVTDLAGNVAEWCGDWIGPYAAGAARDPSGPPTGSVRAVRGGSFVHETTWARGSARAGRKADEPVYLVGFRVVRELTDQERMFLPAPPSDAAGGREAGRP